MQSGPTSQLRTRPILVRSYIHDVNFISVMNFDVVSRFSTAFHVNYLKVLSTHSHLKVLPTHSHLKVLPTHSHLKVLPTHSYLNALPTHSYLKVIPMHSYLKVLPTLLLLFVGITMWNFPEVSFYLLAVVFTWHHSWFSVWDRIIRYVGWSQLVSRNLELSCKNSRIKC